MQQAIFNHLQSLFQQVDGCLQYAVNLVQEHGFDATDALRGLVVRPGEAQELMDSNPLAGLWQMDQVPQLILGDGSDSPFAQMVRVYDLSPVDCYIILLVLAPELDQRYQRIYGYLQDDVTLRYPTVNLMMHLLSDNATQRYEIYRRVQEPSPLIKHHLIHVESPENRPNSLLLHQHIKIDGGLRDFLIGDTELDRRLKNVLEPVTATLNVHLPENDLIPVLDAMSQSPLVFMLGNTPLEHLETAATLSHEYNMELLHLKAENLPSSSNNSQTATVFWSLALREAALRRAAIYISGWETRLTETGELPIDLWQALAEFPNPIFISAREKWEPDAPDRRRLMLRLDFDDPEFAARHQAWQQLLQGDNLDKEVHAELAAKYRFHRQQIVQAVQTARDLAASSGKQIQKDDLEAAARAHSRLRLGRFARHIETTVGWEKLILPPEPLAQLHEMVDRVRFAHIVQDDWGYGSHIANSKGISALFAGESGTGKTLSAETIATELGLPLYKIDLSGIVDKYIGETEKNLRVIFEEAQSNSAILFFDEADAIFGKRSEVKDARDRYANIEVAYLLQQIEDYDGIAILATNLRQNLDDAFTRRLDFLINFPFPEAEYRAKIWKAHFPEKAPLSPNVDIMAVAERYELSGGNIRNITLASAYLAATSSDVITMDHIRSAIRREHQKLGRLLQD